MVKQLRNQAPEMHFDKFSDPSTFQCWKTSLKTEVCSCSGFPTAESVDDLKTSQSTEGTAKIAPASKKIVTNPYSKKRVILRIKWRRCKNDFSAEDRLLLRYKMGAQLSTKELPKDCVLKSLYNMRIRESVQLQTVVAMYEQEIHQVRSRPN